MSKARIADYNDLEDQGNGEYHLNFRHNKDTGSVRIHSDDLAEKWYCSYEFKLNDNWDWGTTGYDGNDRFLSNIKIFRLWNPGSTPENFVIALQGWNDGIVWALENVGDQGGAVYGFKDRFTKNTWHKLEFEFWENSAPGAADGGFRMWHNGEILFDENNIITRLNESGFKRPFILGWDSVWGPSGGNDKAPNDFDIKAIHPGMNETPGNQPPIDPPIDPPVTPVTYPRDPEKINNNLGRLAVPGGWLVLDSRGQVSSMVFLPDPESKWQLESDT